MLKREAIHLQCFPPTRYEAGVYPVYVWCRDQLKVYAAYDTIPEHAHVAIKYLCRFIVNDAVAVAVIAKMFTLDGKILLSSPKRENSLLKSLPLCTYNNIIIIINDMGKGRKIASL